MLTVCHTSASWTQCSDRSKYILQKQTSRKSTVHPRISKLESRSAYSSRCTRSCLMRMGSPSPSTTSESSHTNSMLKKVTIHCLSDKFWTLGKTWYKWQVKSTCSQMVRSTSCGSRGSANQLLMTWSTCKMSYPMSRPGPHTVCTISYLRAKL